MWYVWIHDRTSCAASLSLPQLKLPGTPSFRSPDVTPTASSSNSSLRDSADNREDVRHRSMFPRLPRGRGVTVVDVETLSSDDIAFSECGSPGWPAYESDPPWEEIQASVPKCLLPRVIPWRCFQTKETPLLPHPATMTHLVQNLVHAITATPPLSLSQLLSYHAAHVTLHTTASFNLLIKSAIRHASFGTVGDLLSQMVQEDVPGDLQTRALRVRAMVRSGFWNRAWGEQMAQLQETEQGIPLPVWLEFFGSVKRGAISGRWQGYGSTGDGRAKSLQTPAPSVTAERFLALMQHPPLVTQKEWQEVPAGVIYALVRSLVAQDRRTAAMDMTRTYFQSLPHDLEGEWRRVCLGIIHLHMAPERRARNLSEHFTGLKTLYSLLGMHHSFEPTSTTLFFLLRSLRSTKRCGERADRLVRSFERRWGPDIVDDRVRRRWAALWIKQQNLDRAAAIVSGQTALDEQRVGWRAEKEASGVDSGKDHVRQIRWLDVHRAPRKSRERWHWRLLRRRLAREQVRHSR